MRPGRPSLEPPDSCAANTGVPGGHGKPSISSIVEVKTNGQASVGGIVPDGLCSSGTLTCRQTGVLTKGAQHICGWRRRRRRRLPGACRSCCTAISRRRWLNIGCGCASALLLRHGSVSMGSCQGQAACGMNASHDCSEALTAAAASEQLLISCRLENAAASKCRNASPQAFASGRGDGQKAACW